jgi:hypothetical protein
MLVVGIGAASFIFSELLINFIFNPIIISVINVAQENCPPYWWNYLGGNMMLWIVPFIFSIMVVAAVLVICRVVFEIGNDVKYEDETW